MHSQSSFMGQIKNKRKIQRILSENVNESDIKINNCICISLCVNLVRGLVIVLPVAFEFYKFSNS